jgi:hypothetical protein
MDDPTIAAHVDASAALLGLPLAPGHRPGVLLYFALAAAMAEQVNGLPLTVHDESGSHFVPVSPGAAE